MGEKAVIEKSSPKLKAIILMWLERNDSRLMFSPLVLNPLSPDVEFSEYFHAMTYDGRIIREFVRCQKCGVLISKRGNRKYTLKRHLDYHKNPKVTAEIHSSNISTVFPLTSSVNTSIDSRGMTTDEHEMNAIPPQVCTRSTTRLSTSSDDTDIWFDALDSI